MAVALVTGLIGLDLTFNDALLSLNKKGHIIIAAFLRSSFITAIILIGTLSWLTEIGKILFGEDYASTPGSTAGFLSISFILTIIIYYLYERLFLQKKSYSLAKVITKIDNKFPRKKPIVIEENPELRKYVKYIKELENIYEFFGIIATAVLLFISIEGTVEPADNNEELELRTLVLYMIVYVQAAYYKLPLRFLYGEDIEESKT